MSQAVLKHVVSKDFIFKKSMHARDWYPAKNEEPMALFHIKIFHVMLATLLLKRKYQHVGHIQIFLWSVGQMSQQV